MPNPIPATPDAERHLLGVLIRDGLPFPPDLLPSDFHEPSHQEVASVFVQMWADGIQPDELTVSQRLREAKAATEAHAVSKMASDVGASMYNPGWADIVRQQSVLRHLARTAEKVASLASDPAADPSALLAYAEGSFKAVQGRGTKTDSESAQLMPLETLAAFERKEDPNNVIGNRWLCKGGSMLLVSQSGVGKSSWSLQMMISLAVKRPFFGIEAKRPLRVVMLQAENDLGDVAEAYQDIVAGMNLYPDEARLLTENLHIYRDTSSVGPEFLKRMRELTVKHAADVFLCDPLLSFCGIEVADQQQMTNFLRHGINPILFDTGVIGVYVHHTTKPRSAKDKEGQTVADLAYAGAGASELTNWVRECGCLQRQTGDDPVFKFALTKRRGRSGMKDENGDFKSEITVRHSKVAGVIRWEYAPTVTEAAQPKPDSSPAKGGRKPFDAR